MSKYKNIKILKQVIAAALNEENELALLLTIRKIDGCIKFCLSFIVSLRYFVDQEFGKKIENQPDII